MKGATLFILVSLTMSNSHGYFVQLSLHANGGCGGTTSTENLDFVCMSYPNFGYSVSGASISRGSCVKIHTELQCGGQTYMLAYPEYLLCNLPCCGWNDHVLSAEDCDTRIVQGVCPSGTYVRKMEYRNGNEGMSMYCYKPTEDTHTSVFHTHGSAISNPSTTRCPIAAHGLSLSFTNGWEIYETPSMECARNFDDESMQTDYASENHWQDFKIKRRSSSAGQGRKINRTSHIDNAIFTTHANRIPVVRDSVMCENRQAFSGIRVEIDDAGTIKEATSYCSPVLDPSQMCEPVESLALIIQCDNSHSGNDFSCGYSQTIGVGESTTMTETERREYQFSVEYGYSIGGTISGLSASMSATLGYSELVGYEWSQSDTTTWTLETTISATIHVRPYTNSKLEQLKGKCSFYGTSVNYFKQTDVTGTSTTVRYFRAMSP